MCLPFIFESGISLLLYAFLFFILIAGLWQFIKSRFLLKEGEAMRFRSLIPLGGAAAAFGFIGLFKQYSDAYQAIEMAGDISVSIVAGAFGAGGSYPMLGLLSLAISCVFGYVDQGEYVRIKSDKS